MNDECLHFNELATAQMYLKSPQPDVFCLVYYVLLNSPAAGGKTEMRTSKHDS